LNREGAKRDGRVLRGDRLHCSMHVFRILFMIFSRLAFPLTAFRNKMILRASAKFQRQYRQKAEETELPVQPFPQTWNLDLLPYGRSQIIVLASEEYSLFSFFIPLTRSTDFRLFFTAFQVRLTPMKGVKQVCVIS